MQILRVLLSAIAVASSVVVVGCGGGGETAPVVDSTDAQAIADYEQMIKDEENAAQKAMEQSMNATE